MAVLEFVLEFALLSETAAVIQIALEDVPGINLEKIERDGLFRLFRGGDGGAFRIHLRSSPTLMSDEESAAYGGQAKEVFHYRVGLSWLNPSRSVPGTSRDAATIMSLRIGRRGKASTTMPAAATIPARHFM